MSKSNPMSAIFVDDDVVCFSSSLFTHSLFLTLTLNLSLSLFIFFILLYSSPSSSDLAHYPIFDPSLGATEAITPSSPENESSSTSSSSSSSSSSVSSFSLLSPAQTQSSLTTEASYFLTSEIDPHPSYWADLPSCSLVHPDTPSLFSSFCTPHHTRGLYDGKIPPDRHF